MLLLTEKKVLVLAQKKWKRYEILPKWNKEEIKIEHWIYYMCLPYVAGGDVLPKTKKTQTLRFGV